MSDKSAVTKVISVSSGLAYIRGLCLSAANGTRMYLYGNAVLVQPKILLEIAKSTEKMRQQLKSVLKEIDE